MIDRTATLASQAKKHYSDNGFQSLVKSGAEKVVRDLVRRRALSREDLKKTATHRNSIWYMDQEDSFTIPPLEHDALNEAFEDYQKKYTPEQPFVCEIKDCYILGPGAVGMTNDGRLISETYSGNFPSKNSLADKNLDFYFRGLGLRRDGRETSHNKTYFPLISEYISYYHWMAEYLPKLRLLEYYKQETGKKPTILVDSNPSNFVRESLSAIGYGSDQYEEWDTTERQLESLIVPIHRSHVFDYQNPEYSDYNPSRADFVWLREVIRSNIDINKSKNKGKKIYISRQEASSDYTSSRKVINYKEFSEVLDSYGFEPYALEEMSFREQVQLMADADVIMGPHGAGLVNIIFADNPLVIELFPQGILKPHFYFLSKMMGFKYEPIITTGYNGDLVVDIEVVKNKIDLLVREDQI